MNLYQKIQYLALALCFLVAAYNYKKVLRSDIKVLLYVVLLAVVIEFSSFFFLNYTEYGTLFIYNISDILFYSLFWNLFYRIIKRRILVLVVGIVYLMAILFSIIFEDIYWTFYQVAPIVGACMTIVLVITFYIQLLKKEVYFNFSKLPSFWAVTGLLVYSVGYLPILIYYSLQSDISDIDFSPLICFLMSILYLSCTYALLLKTNHE